MMNKTMDRDDLFKPEFRKIIDELNELMAELRERKLVFSTWYGQLDVESMSESERVNRGPRYEPYPRSYDDRFNPWFKYWEICQICLYSGILEREGSCLDMGGASSIFTYYLASRGNSVEAIEIKQELVDNGNHVAREMGWNLNNKHMDMENIHRYDAESFDYVFSVCVMEHLNRRKRASTAGKVKRILSPNGVFGITFDYLNPKPMIGLNTPRDVKNQFMDSSGLELYGEPFKDVGKRYLIYLGQLYTFGSLLLKKTV